MKFSTFRSRKPASKRQPASRRRRRALFESLESRQLLAVDLQVTDAYLIDGMGLRINEPVLGEQMFVRVEFATTDLPVGSQYQVEVQIDGVPRRSGTLFNGAGSATGSGSVTLNGWFATQPTHELFARVDADNVVPENDELNNSTVVQLNSAAGLPPFKFAWPVGADVYDQVVPLRYVDIDPSGGAMDYAGGTATSNGSFGLTIGAVNFRDQDAGIPVLAAADGVVQSATDGLGDRNTFAGFAPGNSVIIDHGNGWTTEYRHLRRDSVTVVPNQLVTAGETIGMLGASGGSSGPNVEFVVRHLGRVVDPLIDPSSLLLFPVPSYSGDTVALIDGGVTTYDPTSDLLEGPSELAEWSPVGSQNMYAWGAFTGLKQDDELKAVWYRPDQTEDGFEIVTVLQDTNFLRQAFQNPAMTQRDTGTWTVEFLVNDVKVGERTFEVVSPGQPDAYFTRFGSQVVDDRFTPLNIGTSTVGNVFRPTMTIFVSNLGDDLLTFG
ncbi:MAG: peptidoglycan DD-metalloendopeptidase family protein, partial [Planctomycetales bacterium]|nr:peptidoglycan DD-metalloendopeptidase family protein [Planctomycetales bacterium]